MVSTCGKVIFIFAIIATLCGTPESCTVGSFTEDPDNCNNYFLCISAGAATININLECPVGQGFDPINAYCSSSYECLVCD